MSTNENDEILKCDEGAKDFADDNDNNNSDVKCFTEISSMWL